MMRVQGMRFLSTMRTMRLSTALAKRESRRDVLFMFAVARDHVNDISRGVDIGIMMTLITIIITTIEIGMTAIAGINIRQL